MFRRAAAIFLLRAAAVSAQPQPALRGALDNASSKSNPPTDATVGAESHGGVKALGASGAILEERRRMASQAGWTLQEVDAKRCATLEDKRLKPSDQISEVYFPDDETGKCWQVLENGAEAITVGRCFPNGPGNGGSEDPKENWQCLGRCGAGCSDASLIGGTRYTSHWSLGCLVHDICCFFTDSPQDPTAKLPLGPLTSLTCRTAVQHAMRSYVSPRFTYVGDSSYSGICSK